MPFSSTYFDTNDGVYRFNKSKRKVSQPQLYYMVNGEKDKWTRQAIESAQRTIRKEATLEQFQLEMADIIRRSHVDMYRRGRGGKDRTYANNYLEVARDLKDNYYPRLEKLAVDVSDGKLSEKQFLNRVRQLTNGSTSSYERGRISTEYEYGRIYGRRKLSKKCSPHCEECLEYAGEGIKPVLDIVPPKMKCRCGPNCCCSVKTYTQQEYINLPRNEYGEVILSDRLLVAA